MGNTVIVQAPLGNVAFAITNAVANTVTMPLNVTSTATRNIPLYIIGSSIPATNWFPTYQGTATLASGNDGNNFYGANSTSSWNPAFSGIIYLNDGDDEWYRILNVPLTNTVSTSEQLNYQLTMQIVSDTNDTIVQFSSAASLVGELYDQLPIHNLDSRVLTANLPSYITYTTRIRGSAALDAGSIYMRNITSGANLTIAAATMVLTKQKL